MSRTPRLLCAGFAALCLAIAVTVPAMAQTSPAKPIKVGTLAPEGTPWFDVIQEIGAKWKKASGGQISLTIFGGGVQGTEAAMIIKMRTNQLQMGAFTTVGLETITKEMSALWIPLLFQNYDELDYVRSKLDARMEKALGDKGFVVLNWGDAGWVKYFAKKPIPTLKALQEQKLFVWAGDSQSEEMYKDAGFRIVPLPETEILMNLQRNMIEAFPAPATLALANQWFGLAKNMMDIKFAPVVGATIITKAAWEAIDPSLRPTLLTLARETGAKFTPKIRALETEAIDAMVKRGLQIQKLTPQAEQEWQQMAEKFYPKIRGTIVPADLFDEVRRLVLEYRAQKKAGPPMVIKAGTLAPEGTPWYDVIQEIGAKWKRASGDRISLTIVGGSAQGDEAGTIRKLRSDEIQMGAVGTVGLETITKDMSALWIPLLFQNYHELDYVRGKLDARLGKAMGDKGFVVLNWGDGGWVRYFAKKPIPTLKALQELKLISAGNAQSDEMYTSAGFKIAPRAPTDILTSLKTNMIEAFPAPATAALGNQWFSLALNMMDIKVAPVVGATIITKAAWEKIDASLRPTLLALAQETGAAFAPAIRGLETTAIDAMVKQGLQIQKLTPQAEQEWQQTGEKFYPKIRGSSVPADLFDDVKRLVMEYRAQKRAGPANAAAPVKK